MGINIISAIWAFIESTIFFVVPDVWLTVIAKDSLKGALIASLYALMGAMLGGSLWYFISFYLGTDSAYILMDKLPALTTEHIIEGEANLRESGLKAMMISPWVGTPYKIYSVVANGVGVDYWTFMLYSIPARLTRFVVLILVSSIFVKILDLLHIKIDRLFFVLLVWITFYAYI